MKSELWQDESHLSSQTSVWHQENLSLLLSALKYCIVDRDLFCFYNLIMITWIHNVFVIPHEESFDFAKLRFDSPMGWAISKVGSGLRRVAPKDRAPPMMFAPGASGKIVGAVEGNCSNNLTTHLKDFSKWPTVWISLSQVPHQHGPWPSWPWSHQRLGSIKC